MTLLTKQDLMRRWQTCERTVRRLAAKLGLPRHVLTVRSVRFSLVDVISAENRARRLRVELPSGVSSLVHAPAME